MTVSDLNVRVAFLNDLKKGLAGIERDLRRASRNFAQVGNEMSMALSLPLAAFGVRAVQTAAEMESLKLAMRTTFQDAGRSIQEADKELEALRKSALAPGLDFEQAVKASIRLQNVGMSAEKARATIEQMANAISMSGGTAEDLDGVSIQMAQMISKGKVLAQDLRIIQERMPKITSLMKDAFGVSTADAMQEMGVSGVEFVEKITAEMQKLPRVSGGLANSIVNMGASVKTFLATIGDDIAETFDLKAKFEQFGGWLTGVAERFKNLSDGTKAFILYTGAAVIALGPLFKVFGAISGMASQIIAGFGTMVGWLKNMSGVALVAAKAFQALSLAQKATIIGLGIAIVTTAVAIWSNYSDKVDAAAESQKRVQTAISDTQTEIAKEKIEADLLFATLKDLSKSTYERGAALDSLKSKYPAYLEGMSLEEMSLNKIEEAQKLVNAEIVRSVALKMKANAQNEIAQKIAEKMTRITQLKAGAEVKPSEVADVNAMELWKAGGLQKSAIWQANQDLKVLNDELINIDKQFEKTFGTARTGESVVTSEMLDNYYNPAAPTPRNEKTPEKKKGGKKAKEEKTVTSVIDELTKAYDMAAVKGQALGDEMGIQSERAALLKSAIETLLEMGVKPTDEALVPLIERYKALGLELDMLPAHFSVASEQMALATTTMATQATTIGSAFAAMGETIAEAMGNAGNSMMELAGQGETSLKKLGKAALKSAADTVRAALMSYVANVIKDTGIVSGPLAPFLAPAAGAAAGIGFNAILKGLKIPAFANEGMVQTPTLAMFGEYAGARQNPEYALKENRLQGLLHEAAKSGGGGGGAMQITGYRIDGRDLYLALEQAGADVRRRRGG